MYSNEIDSRHVVPIGGAQFVPPIMTHFGHVPHFTTSPTSEASSSASGSYSPRESLSSPIHSRFSSSSSSSGSATSDLEEWDSVQAHLSYAKQMASHTAAMWQKERLAIEKAKLEGTYTGHVTSRQNGNALPPPEAAQSTSPSTSSSSESKRFKRFSLLTAIFSPSSQRDDDQQRGRSRIRRNH